MARADGGAYTPMTLAELAEYMSGAEETLRWRLVAEFLEEYSWEPGPIRAGLLTAAPGPTDDERWDVFLAALAEHLSSREGQSAPSWVGFRPLHRFWFPFNTQAARADAIVHAPASFRSRGIFVAPQELGVA